MHFTLLAAALSVASAALAVPSPRGTCDNGSACYSATHGFEYNDKEQYQRNLMDACTADESVTECGDLWGSAACVAAAISFSKIWVGVVLCARQAMLWLTAYVAGHRARPRCVQEQ